MYDMGKATTAGKECSKRFPHGSELILRSNRTAQAVVGGDTMRLRD